MEVNTEAIARDIQAVIGERDRLRAENAALWRFVRADDAMQAHDRECDGEDADACQVFGAELVYAREALRPYEDGGDR